MNNETGQGGLRVFVLGAGVSNSCGIPVARELLHDAMRTAKHKSPRNYEKIVKLLQYLYPAFSEQVANYPNIEDFLGLVDMATQFNDIRYISSTLWAPQDLESARNAVIRVLTSYLWKFTETDERLESIIRFGEKVLRRGDVVIAFNWDLTLERFIDGPDCEDVDLEYFFESDKAKRSITLLKPHGSIDWFLREEVRKVRPEREYRALGQNLVVYPYFRLSADPKMLNLLPQIIPPTPFKKFRFSEYRRTWKSVFHSLKNARQIILLGYSLPKEDVFARFVFRRAIRNNPFASGKKSGGLKVFLVNPDEQVEFTFRRVIGDKVRLRFFQGRFEEVDTELYAR